MIKINCKHGTATNVVGLDLFEENACCPVDIRQSGIFIVPIKALKAGTELFWDYGASATEEENHVCECKGEAWTLPKDTILDGFSQITFCMAECKGFVYNMKKTKKTKQSKKGA